MKFLLIVFLLPLFFSCSNQPSIREVKGYVVYILPNKVRFVETIREPDTKYIDNFSNKNFSNAISFEPNCVISNLIENIKVDTLYDENPDLKDHSYFMRQPLIFPAEITLIDTVKNKKEIENQKFKMVYKGKLIQFEYNQFNGVIINLRRLNKS